MKTRNESLDTVTFFVQRDFCADHIELAVEVLGYIPEHENGGCTDERRGADIRLGNAFTLDGVSFELTPLEREAAEEVAIKEIQSRPALEEEEVL